MGAAGQAFLPSLSRALLPPPPVTLSPLTLTSPTMTATMTLPNFAARVFRRGSVVAYITAYQPRTRPCTRTRTEPVKVVMCSCPSSRTEPVKVVMCSCPSSRTELKLAMRRATLPDTPRIRNPNSLNPEIRKLD